jgi:CRP-like cAMP-binding protein
MAEVPGGEGTQRTGEPALAQKVRGHIVLGPRDLAALAVLCRERETVRRGAVLLDRERSRERAFLVEHGWGMRFSILPDGRRQILAFVLPGDTFGLSDLILGYPSESVAAITPLTIARLTLEALQTSMREHPSLCRAFLWSTAQEYTLLCDRLTSLGRRGALERVARALLELTMRWNAVRCDTTTPALPLTQPLMADALGLSTVHVNRSLQRLRAAGLISVQRGPIVVEDASGLARVANIEPGDALHPLFTAWLASAGVSAT